MYPSFENSTTCIAIVWTILIFSNLSFNRNGKYCENKAKIVENKLAIALVENVYLGGRYTNWHNFVSLLWKLDNPYCDNIDQPSLLKSLTLSYFWGEILIRISPLKYISLTHMYLRKILDYNHVVKIWQWHISYRYVCICKYNPNIFDICQLYVLTMWF